MRRGGLPVPRGRRRAVARRRRFLLLDGLHEQVLAAVEVRRDQRLAVGDQVADAHAGAVRVAQRLRHMALERHRIGELRRNRQQCQHVAVAQRLAQAVGVETEVLHLPRRAGLRRVDAFELGAAHVRQHRRTAAVAQQVAHGLLARLELVDRRCIGGTGQRHALAHRLEHHDVAG
jgi:hypothetical protein